MAIFIFLCFKKNMFNVSFRGQKENMVYAQEAIAEVKKDFPDGFKSNTHYETFENPEDKMTISFYTDLIMTTRRLIDYNKRFGLSKQEATQEAVKETGAANCGEQAVLVSQKLDKKGIKNEIISINTVYSTPHSRCVTSGHTFCVIDCDEKMNIQNPETWGENAIIVDMWSGTIAKVKEAIEFFKTFIKPKENEHIQFEKESFY